MKTLRDSWNVLCAAVRKMLWCLLFGIKGCGSTRHRLQIFLQHPRTHSQSSLLSGWKGRLPPGAKCQRVSMCELALLTAVQKLAARAHCWTKICKVKKKWKQNEISSRLLPIWFRLCFWMYAHQINFYVDQVTETSSRYCLQRDSI